MADPSLYRELKKMWTEQGTPSDKDLVGPIDQPWGPPVLVTQGVEPTHKERADQQAQNQWYWSEISDRAKCVNKFCKRLMLKEEANPGSVPPEDLENARVMYCRAQQMTPIARQMSGFAKRNMKRLDANRAVSIQREMATMPYTRKNPPPAMPNPTKLKSKKAPTSSMATKK
jgi:hypothetical protein